MREIYAIYKYEEIYEILGYKPDYDLGQIKYYDALIRDNSPERFNLEFYLPPDIDGWITFIEMPPKRIDALLISEGGMGLMAHGYRLFSALCKKRRTEKA